MSVALGVKSMQRCSEVAYFHPYSSDHYEVLKVHYLMINTMHGLR